MRSWLEHLEQALQRSVRQGDVRAIKAALGIARRRMKLQRKGGGKRVKPGRETEGFPITIFSEAIKAMEKKDRDENGSS